jgi:signal transduction histidine kinase
MWRLPAQSRIRIGFWLLTLALLTLGVVAAKNALEAAEASRDVARTNELVKQLEKLLSGLKDVEVGQREYILTGDEQFLQNIRAARVGVRQGLDGLGEMRADQRWLELLKTAIPQKFEEIDQTVQLRRAGGMEAASQMVLAERGQRAMDDIRKIVNSMIQEENRLLSERSGDQRRRFLVTMVLFGALLFVTILLIWSIAFLIQRESRRIREINEDLERRVALRTEELQRSNEDLQQFAYVASHDMKEPMRMIASYSALLQRRYQGRLDGDADTYIGFIVDGVKRMTTLITDLLEYSRAGQSKEEQEVQVEPAAVFDNVVANLKVTIGDAGARVTRDALPPIVYDPVGLSQLLQNLIANGIKYRDPSRPPLIHVSAKNHADETVFSVRDNGAGIAPEHLDQIFGIFKRLHGNEIEGTGIGLAMCKKIVERHGGRIWAESVPGEGSTFYFTVPHTGVAVGKAAG